MMCKENLQERFKDRKNLKVSPFETASPSIESDVFMDLRGVACPMNYVKAKLQIEEMELGQTMLIYLDEGAPIKNVPISLRDDGQDILRIDRGEGFYGVLIRKVI